MNDKSKSKWMREYARVGHIAFLFPASILIGYFVGDYIDSKTGQEPLFTLLFIILGFASALWTLLKDIEKMDEENNNQEEQ